jgi:hypothetical protein
MLTENRPLVLDEGCPEPEAIDRKADPRRPETTLVNLQRTEPAVLVSLQRAATSCTR